MSTLGNEEVLGSGFRIQGLVGLGVRWNARLLAWFRVRGIRFMGEGFFSSRAEVWGLDLQSRL